MSIKALAVIVTSTVMRVLAYGMRAASILLGLLAPINFLLKFKPLDPALYLALATILFYISKLLIRRSGEAKLRRDKRRPILYLRSFQYDTTIFRRRFWQPPILLCRIGVPETDEQSLARLLGRLGPVVAIGRPGEWLTTIGATRIYVGNNDWQATVARLMSEASLVVLRVGDSPGLLWELIAAKRLIAPCRLVLWNPRANSTRRKAHIALCAEFRKQADQVFPHRLPDDLADREVIFFDETWKPVVAEPRPASAWEAIRKFMSGSSVGRLRREFAAALDNARLPIPRPPWKTTEITNFILYPALFCFAILLMRNPIYMLAVLIKLEGGEIRTADGKLFGCGTMTQERCKEFAEMALDVIDDPLLYIIAFVANSFAVALMVGVIVSILIKIVHALIVLFRLTLRWLRPGIPAQNLSKSR